MKPTYSTTSGERLTTSQIEARIRKAKAERLRVQLEEHNYNFCEVCGNNGNGTRLDLSHDISVKQAKEEGRAQECWNVGNLVVLCRICHQSKDKLNTQFNSI